MLQVGMLKQGPKSPAWECGLLLGGRGRWLHSGKRTGQEEAGATALFPLFNLGFFLGKSQASPNHSQTQIRRGSRDAAQRRDGGRTEEPHQERGLQEDAAGWSRHFQQQAEDGIIWNSARTTSIPRMVKTQLWRTRCLPLDFSETDDALVMIPGL